MKLPSVKYLLQHATSAFLIHPAVIISAGVAVFFAILLIEKDPQNSFPYINLLLCGYLGVPLFLAVDIYSDAAAMNNRFRLGLLGIVILTLAGVYFYLPDSEDTLNTTIPYIRFTILAIAGHLLVSFAAFLRRGTLNGFWQFNKVLFLRFLLTALYSGFFYVGLVLALVALEQLFKIDIYDELYFEMFIFIAGIFNTWFFVANVPKDYSALDIEEDYPNGLRVFILYVLIPLLGLYFLILYGYSFKILYLWDWPSGIITYMIIAVAVLGVLAMLLAYPFSIRENSGPIHFLRRGYCWVLIPIIIVLYLAIGIRVADYGVTINRYITLFLAIWLTGISVYIITGGKDIRQIPLSLFVIILICSFGPWGVFDVSGKSQVRRLQNILTDSEILIDGKIRNEPEWISVDTIVLKFDNQHLNEGILSDSLHNEVMSITNYLEEYHGLKAIEGWFAQSPHDIAKKMKMARSEDNIAVRLMGLKYGNKNQSDFMKFPSFHDYRQNNQLTDVSEFDFSYDFDFSFYSGNNDPKFISFESAPNLDLKFDRHVMSLILKEETDTLRLDFEEYYQSLKEHPEMYKSRNDQQDMIITGQSVAFRAKVHFEHIAANESGISSCSGILLIDLVK